MEYMQIDPLNSLGALKVAKELLSDAVGPVSVHQCIQAGSARLEQSKVLLLQKRSDSKEYIIPPKERIHLHRDYEELVSKREQLENDRTWVPLKNIRRAWQFNSRSDKLYVHALSASDRSITASAIQEAMAELAEAEARAKAEAKAAAGQAEAQAAGHNNSREDSDNASIYYDCEETDTYSPPVRWQGNHTISETRSSQGQFAQYRDPPHPAHSHPKYAKSSAERSAPYPGYPGNLQPLNNMSAGFSQC